MASGKWPILAVATATWQFPVVHKVNIAGAKKDAHARRFYNKGYTDCDDLLGAVSFWIGIRAPVSSLSDFLKAIEPQSKWRDDPDYDATKTRGRQRHDYGPHFNSLISGYWGDWERDK